MDLLHQRSHGHPLCRCIERRSAGRAASADDLRLHCPLWRLGACQHGCWYCSRWGQMGSKHAKWATGHVAAIPMNSGLTGRWDRNRTCTLRFWRPNPAFRVLSGGVAGCHSAPVFLSSCAAECRSMSLINGAITGATGTEEASHSASVPLQQLQQWPHRLSAQPSKYDQLPLELAVQLVQVVSRRVTNGANNRDCSVPFVHP